MICTFAVGAHRQLAEISTAASLAYARRWGWDVVVSAEPSLPAGRPASWGKVPLMLDLLERYEWVWWIDADALIVDCGRNVLDEIDLGAGPLWLASHPQASDPPGAVENAGVMLARRSAELTEFLAAVWACERFVDHNWWENAAILELLGRDLEPPYARRSESRYRHLVSELSVDWNTVPGYIDTPTAALHHHARADHDSFERRAHAMLRDLARTVLP